MSRAGKLLKACLTQVILTLEPLIKTASLLGLLGGLLFDLSGPRTSEMVTSRDPRDNALHHYSITDYKEAQLKCFPLHKVTV